MHGFIFWSFLTWVEIKIVVDSFSCHKLSMCSRLNNESFLYNANNVSIVDCWESVSNDNASSALSGTVQRLLYNLLWKVLSKLHTKNRVCFTQTCLVFQKWFPYFLLGITQASIWWYFCLNLTTFIFEFSLPVYKKAIF